MPPQNSPSPALPDIPGAEDRELVLVALELVDDDVIEELPVEVFDEEEEAQAPLMSPCAMCAATAFSSTVIVILEFPVT